MSTTPRTVGVLALQGDVREHLRVLTSLGAEAVGVRRVAELERCDGLVLPGGESTTMVKLARAVGLLEPLRERIAAGLPTFGTCAGMILLADRLLDAAPGQETLGGLDVVVRRNAFGRQVDSFEGVADCAPSWAAPFDFPATFIRAPWVEKVGAGVEVVATVPVGDGEARIVAVREGPVLATSFHPEVTGDDRIHRLFLDLVRGS